MRTLRLLLVLPVAAAAVVVGTASPGSAGGARNATYSASWTFEGPSVTGTAGSMQLTDYATAEYFDRVTGTPTSAESIAIGERSCTPGSSHQSGITLYGAATTWANMPINSSQGASVVVHCTFGGQVHRFSWGTHTASNGAFYNATKCVVLTRADSTTFSLDATGCPAEEVTLNTKVQVTSGPFAHQLPFTATIKVGGAGPRIG